MRRAANSSVGFCAALAIAAVLMTAGLGRAQQPAAEPVAPNFVPLAGQYLGSPGPISTSPAAQPVSGSAKPANASTQPYPTTPASAEPAPTAPAPGSSVNPLPGVTSPGPTVCAPECCPESRWHLSGGSIFLHRSTANSAILAHDTATGASFGVENLDLDFATGPRVALLHQGELYDMEFIYFGIDGWSASRQLDHAGRVQLPDLSVVTYDQALAVYWSKLYSIEATVKRHLGERFNFLFGFRWAELDESFGLTAVSNGTAGTVTLDNSNDLYGLQIGLDGCLLGFKQPLHLDGFFKAGVYSNHLRDIAHSAGTALMLVDDNTTNVAFLGETGLTLTWQATQHLAAFGGYEAMWLDGVALAPSVFMGKGIRNTAFYHGAVAGVELRW